MCDNLRQQILSELSRHYDTLLWTVTGLWAAAVGGLLYWQSTLKNGFDPWVTVFGLILTAAGLYFAASFRALRNRVHGEMCAHLRPLHEGRAGFRQWPVLVLVFFGLAVLWAQLLLEDSGALGSLYAFLIVAASWYMGYLSRHVVD